VLSAVLQQPERGLVRRDHGIHGLSLGVVRRGDRIEGHSQAGARVVEGRARLAQQPYGLGVLSE